MIRHGWHVNLGTGWIITITVAASMLLLNCGSDSKLRKEETMPQLTIEQVQAKYTDQWMKIPGVAGTGIGEAEGKPCLKVFVAKKTLELEKKIPKIADGYPVVIEETGEFKALDRK